MLISLIIVLLLVFVLPFTVKKVEEELEIFLFIMGVAAALIAHKMAMPLIKEALVEPVKITIAVFVAGALFYVFHEKVTGFVKQTLSRMPMPLVVSLVVVLLGLISSVITAIVAAILLAEILIMLPLKRPQKVVITIIACFSIGFGAALTPIGEPLATIATSKLHQDFFFLFRLLGKYVIPLVIALGLMSAIYMKRSAQEAEEEPGPELDSEALAALRLNSGQSPVTEEDLLALKMPEIEDELLEQDTWRGIILRAAKVYLFVMALIFLGAGFEPLIERYVLGLAPQALYWINMVSAVLDNATLCAAEMSPAMFDQPLTVEAILMGLLISGGMLIPGNIPNIISASKLRITSTEWARLGVPLGLVIMVLLYVIIFVLGFA